MAEVKRTAPAAPDDPRVDAAVRGDRAALSELLAEQLPRIRNLVRYLVRGDRDVDDIAQEALIAVVRGLAGYRGEGAFRSWVDRIAARVAFAHVRQARAERARAAEAAADEQPDPQEGATEQYALRRNLAALLDRLPGEQRDAVVLHHAAGLSAPEIAELTGTPFETVRSRLRLGMASLRSLMEGGKP